MEGTWWLCGNTCKTNLSTDNSLWIWTSRPHLSAYFLENWVSYAWLVYYNKNLTWENLQKRQWSGPAIFPLCRSDSENNLHIFFQCPQSLLIWQRLTSQFGFVNVFAPTIQETFYKCSIMSCTWRPVLLITIWTIWKWHNQIIFE